MTYYNLHHTHHKREHVIKRMYSALKSWHYKHTSRPSHDCVSAANRTRVRTNVRDNKRWTFNTEHRKHRPEHTFERPLRKCYIKNLTIIHEPNTFPLTLTR